MNRATKRRQQEEDLALRECVIPTCAARYDVRAPDPAWQAVAGPGARITYACPAHSAGWKQHRPVARHYPPTGGVVAECACSWSTRAQPTLGAVHTAFVKHLVPRLLAAAVKTHTRAS